MRPSQRTTVSLLFVVAASSSHAFQASPKTMTTVNPPAVSNIATTPSGGTSSTLMDPFEVMTAATVPAMSLEQQQQQQQVMLSASVPAAANVDFSQVSNVLTPVQAYHELVHKGELNAQASLSKTMFSSILGGAYVGMGAMLSLAVAGNCPELGLEAPGLQKFLFGALFPVNLLLTLQCGGQLYTGNTASNMAALCEGKMTLPQLMRSLGLSWCGNLLGCLTFALACKYAGVLDGGAGILAAHVLETKTSAALGPVLVKALFCNWLVCLAVFLSLQAKDMGGKYLSIWLPVSTFVSIGFEHSVANMFLLPAGLLSTTDISVETAVLHNLLPVTVGNAVSGSFLVGAAMSYMYGKLGHGK